MIDNAHFPRGAALVVGASGGIGSKVAEVLAADGADLALVYNRKAEAAQVIAEKVSTKASVHRCDVTDQAAIRALVDAAVETHGRIHTLVWAAGPLVDQLHLGETPIEKWRKAFEVEVHGFFALVTALLPHMREQGGGSIVHLGSAGHLRWPDRDGLSVAPKASNESWLKGIAREEGRHGIRANSVLVGVIDAGMFHELMAQGAFPPEWVAETQKMLALKRWGQPQEIGYAVSWLASSRATYVTGQQINVSGGFGI
ncbi:SDR family oxidoreductase [uncultured Sphingorhabdus sp.]|uniref:SDR family NAD(P)-dependent oxidoreductase n=1 Tax=uncultured Sphingorhabdus sp. TaxID=1686106 RepID=UPI002639E758|nr:SDR family oxidoreductase [uncultured Sphingorhabdus sp.]HMS19867.1 SDR family oxidoreductase [Sphingorhabdus sp.]